LDDVPRRLQAEAQMILDLVALVVALFVVALIILAVLDEDMR
jgi:hypothetical protein